MKTLDDGRVEIEASDSLGSIAFHFTGKTSRWPELTKSNPQLRTHEPAVPGTILTIPESWLVDVGDDDAAQADALSPDASEREDYDRVKKVLRDLAEWAQKADRTIAELQDRIALLEKQREADQERLAAQGGEIAKLKASPELPKTDPAPAAQG